ncbi:MAG: hypothetical protein AB7N80_05570 [Bdellovibrionales bacterium]
MIRFKLMGLALLAAGAMSANAACPSGTTKRAQLDGKDLCAFSQKKYLNTELFLTADNDYLLEQGTYIGGDNQNSSTLRIQAGTRILANAGTFLVIMRGSKVFALGTAERPVVFTSAKQTERKRGEWGGLVINGNAPINACKAGTPVCEAISEGIKEEQVRFGGNNAQDNSGELRYVRVEFGGYPIAPDNELNGITFNGVGAGTVVDYIQVHMNADDGVEFFGGTVDAKHLVLTANDDDSVDWDMGWVGRAQFIVIRHADDIGDSGFEADNLKSPMDAQPRSNPVIANVTMIGGAKSGYGMLLRRGTAGIFANVAMVGFPKGCINIDDAETFNHGGLKMFNTAVACSKPFMEEANDVWSIADWFNSQVGNMVSQDLQLDGYIPRSGSPLLGKALMLEDLFFEPADYIGAISGSQEDWTLGWTTSVTQ